MTDGLQRLIEKLVDIIVPMISGKKTGRFVLEINFSQGGIGQGKWLFEEKF